MIRISDDCRIFMYVIVYCALVKTFRNNVTDWYLGYYKMMFTDVDLNKWKVSLLRYNLL